MSKAMKYLVRMLNGAALQFFSKGYGIVPDEEATQFESREEADVKARTSGLRWDRFRVEPVGLEPVKQSTNGGKKK